MQQVALIFALIGLCGCSPLSDFKRKLTGPEAAAWAICEKEFGFQLETVPPVSEHTDDYILFAWNAKDARQSGGPIVCKTDGSGTKSIELRTSTVF